jgi:hypothetical protein
VITAFRKSNPEEIEAASRELQDAALRKLIGQLATRRPKSKDGQVDLFAGYSSLNQFIGVEVARGDRRLMEWKLLQKATLAEVSAWLAVDRKISASRRQRNPGMTKLLRDLSKAADGQMNTTVEKALKIHRKRTDG